MEKLFSTSDEARVLENNADAFLKDGNQNFVQALRSLDRALTLRLRAWRQVQNIISQSIAPAENPAGEATHTTVQSNPLSDAQISEFCESVSGAAEKYIVNLNSAGVAAFRDGRFEDSEQILDSAMKLLEDEAVKDYFPTTSSAAASHKEKNISKKPQSATGVVPLPVRLRGSTYNNLGCLERRRGNLEAALENMKKSVTLCGQLSPITLLNMSAVCSQLGRPDDALGYSKKALDLMTSGLVVPMQFNGLAAVAHHNLALALEQVDPTESHAHYKKALEIARRELGNGSTTTVMIQKNLSEFVKHRRESLAAAQASLQGARSLSQSEIQLNQSFGVSDPLASTMSDGPSTEGVLQSVDLSTAVLMDTQRRGKSLIRSGEEEDQESSSRPQTVSGRSLAPKPPGSRGATNAPSRRHQSGDSKKRLGKSGTVSNDVNHPAASEEKPEKSTAGKKGLGAPLPPGVAPGEYAADEEERRKDEMVSYLYGRLKDLVKHEDWWEQRYQAAMRIQCMARSTAARAIARKLRKKRIRRLKKSLAIEQAAASIIKRFLRSAIQRRKDEVDRREAVLNEQRRMVLAAIKMQTTARRYLAKQYVKRLKYHRRVRQHSIKVLQCWFRLTVSHIKAKRMRQALVENAAAERLQDRQNYAAFLIQKTFRSHRSRIRVLLLRGDAKAAREMDWQSNRVHATKIIQSLWRGYRVRKQTSQQLQRIKKRRQIAMRTKNRRESATKIQSLFRGYICRVDNPQVGDNRRKLVFLRLAHQQNKAAVKIQCAWRCKLAVNLVKTLKEAQLKKDQNDKQRSHQPFVPPEDWQALRREKMLL